MPEIKGRISDLSSSVSSGSLGENIRNDFQQREAWSRFLKECEEFYNDHLPYEIIYNPNLSQKDPNYEKRTVDLQFTLASQPTNAFKFIQDILDGLKKTGKKEVWGFPCWPLSSPSFADKYIDSINRVWPYIYDHDQYLAFPEGYLYSYYELSKFITVESELANHSGKVISTAGKMFANQSRFSGEKSSWGYDYDLYKVETLPTVVIMTFEDINVDDITDDIYVRITKINNIDTETAMKNGYVNIIQTQSEITYQEYKIYR
jgi:hypothetical protein